MQLSDIDGAVRDAGGDQDSELSGNAEEGCFTTALATYTLTKLCRRVWDHSGRYGLGTAALGLGSAKNGTKHDAVKFLAG